MQINRIHTPLVYSELPVGRFGNVFDSTTATYKFFWLISLLQIHAKSDRQKISVWEIVTRMVANAWYPVHYFRLSFGSGDSLFRIVKELHQQVNIPIDASVDVVAHELLDRIEEPKVKRIVKILTQNVPYRFLKPWINTLKDNELLVRSQSLENDCLYSLYKDEDEFYIVLNSKWKDYLHSHYKILMDFAYWNLTQFLQKRNPNVPAISSKLIKPEERSSLTTQHKYWDVVLSQGEEFKCIYTGKPLHRGDYDLDHFIPWSFVSHDLLWNLIPSDGSINSSKSNKLPSLEVYLPRLARMQQRSLQIILDTGHKPKLLEDYLSLGHTAHDLACLSENDFLQVYEKTFVPINQIALNMGFEAWNPQTL